MGGERDVNELIDGAPFGRFQAAVVALGLATMILEGYSTYSVSYVGPQLIAAWRISASVLSLVFTASVIASAVAYLLVGPLADLIGRRPLVLAGVVGFGLAMLGSASASGPQIFIFWRVLAGLALGVTLPNIVALVAELAPARARGLCVVILYSGFAIGSALGGLLAGVLMPRYGWPAVFLAGGAMSLALALIQTIALPESVRFLALKGLHPARVAQTLGRITTVPAGVRLVLQGEAPSKAPIADLFRDGRAASTVAVWLVLGLNSAALDALVFWIPTLTARVGGGSGISFTIFLLLGGIVGAYAIGYAMGRLGSYRVLIPVHLAAALGVAAFGFLLRGAPIPLAVLIGLTLPGGTSGMQGLIARLYPTAIRATGVGWAVALGRFIGLGAPLAIGPLLDRDLAPQAILLACAVGPLLSTLALILLARDRFGRQVDRRTGEPLA